MSIQEELLEVSENLSVNYKENNEQYENLISKYTSNEDLGFEYVYNEVVKLGKDFENQCNLLYAYIYYHYC